VIASFYLSDYNAYLKNAKEFTKDKASLSTESVVDELFGKIVDDCERKQKEKEIEEWITLAKSFN
jgi:Leu/Phe-tRNA-protein transferase